MQVSPGITAREHVGLVNDMAIFSCFFYLETKKNVAAESFSRCCCNCIPLRLKVLYGHRGQASLSAMVSDTTRFSQVKDTVGNNEAHSTNTATTCEAPRVEGGENAHKDSALALSVSSVCTSAFSRRDWFAVASAVASVGSSVRHHDFSASSNALGGELVT